jgi:hypothetical protein
MTSFIDMLITIEDEEIYSRVSPMKEVVSVPQEGKYYYYTTWARKIGDSPNERYFTSNRMSHAGKYLRDYDNSSVFLNFNHEEVSVVHTDRIAFYEVTPETDISRLIMANKEEVLLNAQENRYYYVTDYTEIVDRGTDRVRYYSNKQMTNYVGKHTGMWSEGWGKNMKQRSYFIKEGKEVIVEHTPTTAFFRYVPPADNTLETYYKAQNPVYVKELAVVRTPIEGKYYEATFWQRKEGHWSAEKHYTKETTPREYVGKYLRHKKEGYGDGADHWAIFLRDGKEIEIEYDYDGKRAWYEVPEQQTQ